MTKIWSAICLRAALAMALAVAFGLAASSVNAAGGYTYNLVRLFDSTSSPETLAEYVLNDKGQVAYLTTAASTVSSGGTSYYIHLWDPKAAVVDSVVYTAQSLSCSTSSIGICSGTSNPVPVLRGSLSYSGSLALSNTGVVSVAAYFPQAGNVLTYSNTGYINIDLTQQPALSYTVSINNFSQGGLFTQGTQLSAAGARAVVDSGAPGTSALNLGVSSPGGLLLSSAPLSGFWYTGTPGSGSTRPVPAINSAGLASVITSSLAGPPPSLVDLPAGSTTPTITTFGDGTWVSTGHLALNSRGEAAIMTVTPFRAALMPAVRTASPRVLADASVFPNSAPVYAISLSDRDELTFQTIEGDTWPGIWSVAADGAPVEVFSSLDPTFVVHDAVSGAVIEDLSPCNGGTTCTGNHAYWIQSGSYEPYDNIIANNQGAVAFYMVSGNVGPLVVAVPTPGLRPSAPLKPTAQDPTTYLMNFLGPCAALYGGSGFLTPALTTPGGAFNGTCYVDPPTATGYTLTAASGADNFQAIIVPSPLAGGQNSFIVNFQTNGAATSAPLTAGQVYTFPAGGVGTFSITGINATENLSPVDPNAFVLGLTWVNRGAQPTDFTLQPQVDTGPTITNSITGTLGANGWYTSNVTLNWTVTDPLGMITNETGCSATVVTSDTSGQTVTCSATSAGGTASQSVTIKRDATPPVAAATPLPLPDAAGWNNSTVTVTFTGTDATSGIAACSTPVNVSTQGSNQISPTGRCTDNAGNVSAPAFATGINIEETPPVVSDAITDSVPESPTGWYTAPVTVTFAGTDPLSGVAPGSCTSITLSSTGAGQAATGTCTNLAGDVGTLTVKGINIDLTTPVASYTAVPPPNANGWNNTPVTVTFSGTDSVNGSGIASCTAPITLSAASAGQLATGTCSSVAGTVSAPVTDIVNINLTPPTALIINPPNNAGYPVGANVIASYSCTDAVSGAAAANCTGTVPSGTALNTAATGQHNFLVTATDLAGNTGTATASYLVSSLTLTTPGSIWTYAGNGTAGFSGDAGAAINAELHNPLGVATDSTGNLYIADSQNSRVRKVATDGTISTVAGTGTGGFSGDGGAAVNAKLNDPTGLAVDSAGNLYIADYLNQRIRQVATDGTISTVAGNGTNGFSGDGGAATSAQLYDPVGVAVDSAGNIYIAEQYNDRIRKVATNGTVSTVAGNGNYGFSGDGGPATSAELYSPGGVAVDLAGNLYIADSNNSRIRKVATDGTISTVAGNGTFGSGGDGGPATDASLFSPFRIALDSDGNLYIADRLNNSVRKVTTDGVISTIAGNGTAGFAGDGGLAINAQLNDAFDVAFDSTGKLYVADLGGQRVRVLPGTAGSDTAAPVITPTISGTRGINGWYTSNVTVTWAVTDPVAPIISKTGCGTTTVSTDTTGQVVTCSAVGQGGPSTQSVTIKRDATPPVVNGMPSPLPDTYGWNNSGVTVTFSGTDATSGIASCSAPVTISTQGANQTSPSGTCTDNAGNVSAPVTVTGINIDETTPSISDVILVPESPSGWYTAPVTVSFTGTDDLSGVAANGCTSPVTLSTSGPNQSVTGTCTNRAGEVAKLTVSGIKIDTIPPVATATATPAPNANGWNKTPVTLSFSGTDNLNGSGVASCSPSVTLSANGAGQKASGACKDVAGNVSAPATATVSIDQIQPTVNVTEPTNGATYAIGSSVAAGYTCADSLSGLASCVGTVANGAAISTAGIGSHTFTVTATDVASNVTQTNIGYSVSLASQSITFGAIASQTAGTTFGLQATASSGLPVMFTSSPSGVCTISGSMASLLTTGTCTITASQSGNTSYSAAKAISQSFTVTPKLISDTVTLGISSGAQPYGVHNSFAIGPSYTGAPVPTGTVTLYDNSTALVTLALGSNGVAYYTANPLNAGVNVMSARYSGDAHYNPAVSAPVSLNVTPARVNLSGSCWGGTPYKVAYQCVVQVSAATATPPAGSINYSLDGASQTSVALNGGSASFIVATLPAAGAHKLTIAYPGEGNYAAGTPLTASFTTVSGQTQLLISPSSYYVAVGSPITLTVTASTPQSGVPIGSVTFYDNGTTLGTVTIGPNGVASYPVASIPKGTNTYTAKYPATANYAAAQSGGAAVTAH